DKNEDNELEVKGYLNDKIREGDEESDNGSNESDTTIELYELNVHEIESGKLLAWYNYHLWNAIFDQAFNDVRVVSVVRGESTSLVTSPRQNKNKELGMSCKMAGEAAKKWEDEKGAKFLEEIGIKLPKTLKDMLIILMNKAERKCKKIQTLGMINAGYVFSCT
ncbi:14559_t:CDS:2, partial [Entrophospora sp. SA101]